MARRQYAKSWELRTSAASARLLKIRQAGAGLNVLEPVYRWFQKVTTKGSA
jgi:hypothetical protein